MVGATLTDQLSKIWITSNLQLGESIEIIPSFFKITYAQNTGAAWSILEGQMTFFYVITLVALILLGWYFYRLKDYQIIQKIGVALMVSGTLGNFIDRLLFQYVRDSLDFHILGYNFPIFNVADVLLICGVLFIIIDEVLKSFGV
ncbi:signal peptidase II, partial [Listeria monocytogenes]|nr:signal peptidase II [Listeria monocytogenes]